MKFNDNPDAKREFMRKYKCKEAEFPCTELELVFRAFALPGVIWDHPRKFIAFALPGVIWDHPRKFIASNGINSCFYIATLIKCSCGIIQGLLHLFMQCRKCGMCR